jgi:pimeloyl-ACP methyl ester carboxylesterase
MHAVEERARQRGTSRVRLETGTRQPEAMALYESLGYQLIENYGQYADSPLSRCYGKSLRTGNSRPTTGLRPSVDKASTKVVTMSEIENRVGTAQVGDITIAYEDMGNPDDPAVLLIMGLSAQLTFWQTAFCESIAEQGYRVIRFDNRDIGLSTHLDGVRVGGSMLTRMARHQLGLASDVPYTLVDMAQDAIGLLDTLDIEKAHVIGGSMGGMIAQIVAGRHPERVLSLAIFFSSTNEAFLPPPDPRKLWALLSGPGKGATREAYVENAAKAIRTIGSPKYQLSWDEALRRSGAAYDRAHDPAGVVRQTCAVMGTGSLKKYTTAITAPTVVIHGKADGLMRPSGGKAIAKAIKGSKLVLIDGMGHDLPEPLWPQFISALVENFTRSTNSNAAR